jgi:hypothetical protein
MAMTDQSETERELKRVIEESLGADRVSSTRVTPYIDHADEPAYSIAVSMTSERDIPDSRRQTELTQRLVETLTRLGNPRFPYLYFDALDTRRSPEEEDDFDTSPEN